MGPWTKRQELDEWEIEDGDGHVIAQLETEARANLVLASLTGHYARPPDYPIGEPLDVPESPPSL